jgi:integrase
MPTIKTKRSDILRTKEIEETLANSDNWLKALVCLAWLFGKRINELLQVRKEDVYTKDSYLYVRFFVSKKKTRADPPVPKPYLKRITLRNKFTKPVLTHWKTVESGRLFPLSRQLALYYLKKANPQAWFHLFRESLATEMAERGATEEKLMHWFDWERVDTAHDYVKRGTGLTEEYSEREW